MTTSIPDGWELARLRFMARVNPKASVDIDPDASVSFLPMEAIGDDGSLQLDRVRRAAEISQGYTYFEDDDVTVAKITPCFENGKGAVMHNLIGGVGFGTTELIVLRPGEGVNSKFLYYLTQSSNFRLPGEAAMLGSGGQKRVPDLFVKDFVAAWPPMEVQSAIACYLDVEMIRIDALIEEKRRLVAALEQLYSACIRSAMIFGYSSSDLSSIHAAPWLGHLPSQWTRTRLTRIVESACDGPFGSSLKTEHYTDTGVPVIRLQNIGDGVFLDAEPAFIGEDYFVKLDGHDARPGDLIVASLGDERRAPGRCCVVPETMSVSLVKADCFRFRLDSSECRTDFMALFLNSLARPYFLFTAKGTTRQRVTISDVRRCVIALPSLEEQRVIVERVKVEQNNVTSLLEHVARELEALTALRRATITDAVLGRIAVSQSLAGNLAAGAVT